MRLTFVLACSLLLGCSIMSMQVIYRLYELLLMCFAHPQFPLFYLFCRCHWLFRESISVHSNKNNNNSVMMLMMVVSPPPTAATTTTNVDDDSDSSSSNDNNDNSNNNSSSGGGGSSSNSRSCSSCRSSSYIILEVLTDAYNKLFKVQP